MNEFIEFVDMGNLRHLLATGLINEIKQNKDGSVSIYYSLPYYKGVDVYSPFISKTPFDEIRKQLIWEDVKDE